MAAKAGRLQIQLEMQVAQLQRDLDKATRAIDSSAKSWQKSMSSTFAGNFLNDAVQKFGGAIVEVIEQMGNIVDESAKMGVSVEMFQKLSYAASQTGVSMDSVVDASNKLQRTLGENGKAAEEAARLAGMTVAALRDLDVGDALIAVIGGLGDMANAAEQAASGAQVLGKGWAGIKPLAAEGTAGLREMIDAAIVASTEAAKAGDDFGDAVAKMQGAVKVLIAEALGPLLEVLTKDIEKTLKLGDATEGTAGAFSKAKSDARSFGGDLAILYETLGQVRDLMVEVQKGLIFLTKPSIRWPWEKPGTVAEMGKIGDAWTRLMYDIDKSVTATVDSTAQLTTAEEEARKAAQAAAKAALDEANAEKAAADAKKRKAEADRLAARAERDKEKAAAEAERAAEARQRTADQAAGKADEVSRAINETTAARMRLEGVSDEAIRKYLLWLNMASEHEIALSDQAATQTELAKQKADTEEANERRRDLAFEKQQQRAQFIETAIFDIFDGIQQGSDAALEAVKRLVAELLSAIITAKTLQALGLPSTGGLFQQAQGGVWNAGRLIPFAQGGVVFGPTPFKFAGGRGIMGEAGPEAIMPLARDGSGRLGVRGGSGGVSIAVHNHAGAKIGVEQKGQEIAIIVDQVRGTLANDIARGGNVLSGALEGTYRGLRR